MAGRSSPKAESSVLRVVVAVFGVASVVFFVLSLGSIVADTAHLHAGWSIAAAVVVFLPPPILAAFRLLLPIRVLRTLLGAYAVAFTLVIAALPLMMTGTAVPADREPWPFTVAALGTLASAVAWRPPLAWTHLVVTCLAILPARYAMSPGSDLAPTVEDAVFTLSFASIFTALTLAALSNARALDTEMVKARVTASRAATTHAREREQARLDALVHDEVIATLYYASLGKPELAASVRKQARNALANLARLREPDDGSEPAPPTEFVSRVRSVVTELDDSIGLRVRGTGSGLVPQEVAAAFAEATSEAIRNSLEHAGSHLVTRSVTVDMGPETITIEIVDDGAGFDPAVVPEDRLGIAVSIRGRLAGVGGEADIESTRATGTRVTLRWDRQ